MASARKYPTAEVAGAKIRFLREQRGWTTTDLGRYSGFSQQQVSAVELGQINTPIETLQRIAAALGVSLTCLMRDTEPTKCVESSSPTEDTLEFAADCSLAFPRAEIEYYHELYMNEAIRRELGARVARTLATIRGEEEQGPPTNDDEPGC